MPLNSPVQSAGDNGREKKTKTPELHQHLAGLFRGDRCLDWFGSAAFVYRVANISVTRYDPHTYTIRHFHTVFLRAVSICSCLHLMLVTCERLTAIKFTMRYPYIVTTRNIKTAVIAVWIITLACEVPRQIPRNTNTPLNLLVAVVLFSCVLFVTFSYVILYRETRRHQRHIKTGQLPQEEVERFVKESKALKTTVLVVGAVMLCFLPTVLTILYFNLLAVGDLKNSCPQLLVRTFAMLNSLLNPLIYCWRQKEMRRFVFRTQSAPVAPGV